MMHWCRCSACSVTWGWAKGPAVKDARCGYCDGPLRVIRNVRPGDQECEVKEFDGVTMRAWQVTRS